MSAFRAADAEFRPATNIGPNNMPDALDEHSTPNDFLSLLWTEELWQLIADRTNDNAVYVKQKNPDSYVAKLYTPITVDELKAFFGCRVAIEMLIHKDRYEQYWKSKDSWLVSTPGFGKVFSRDRFLGIWSLLHCVDETDANLDKTDKIYKSRPVFDKLIEKFRHYYVPDCELSLDEGMIPTKNALSFKQYLKDKPIKWGIKTFLLCESKSGYIVNAEIYTGKVDNDPTYVDELGVTGSLVVRISQPYHGQNYCLYTDRFYTSVNLATYLLENNETRLCGTALTNRKNFPKVLIQKKMDRGSSEKLYNGTVQAIVWCDKKPIYFVTTKYVDATDETALRYSREERKRVPVQCPKAVKCYNEYMGGTDRNDQVTKLCRIRRHYKWPRRLMIKFFMWAAFNAYILHGYKVPHRQPRRRYLTFHKFLNDLCHELVGPFRRPVVPFHRRNSAERGPSGTRLVNSGPTPQHLVEKAPDATSNKRCVVCSEKYNVAKRLRPHERDANLPKRSKTVFRCATCNVFLCVGAEPRNCFRAYHTVVEYWR